MTNKDTIDSRDRIDWEAFAKENNLSMEDFISEIFFTTAHILSVQMEENNWPEIAVPIDKYDLVLRRAKPIKKEYNH